MKEEELAINGGPKTRTKPFPPRFLIGEEEKEAVLSLLDKAIQTGEPIIYNGAEEEAYCREFADFLGGGYADAVSSGTSALFVALHALNPEPFSEVIVSAVTDPGGMMPIVFLNCIPIIADTAPDSYNTSAEQIEELISPLTSAIVVAHIGGEPADIENIVALARRYKIPVIEDCAQAHGAKLNGNYVGTFGDISVFSTMFGKHYCTGGQGGIVFTKSEELYWKIKRAADRGKPFGLPQGSTNAIASLNFNLDELSCAIGRVQLKKLPKIVGRRREIVERIKEGIKDLETISLPPCLPGAEPSYWFLRIRFHKEKCKVDKERFCQALIAEGLPITPSYKFAMPHMMDWFKNRSVFGKSGYPWASPEYKGDPNRDFPTPNALEAMEKHFNLTIYESWGEEEVKDIIKGLRKVAKALEK
ncbi:MAG: DegT/DnrJ/EryC1/StrS family aminotransferase [bacterium]